MTRFWLTAAMILAGAGSQADPASVLAWKETPSGVFTAIETDLDTFRWIARPVVVFADSPLDPAFQTQMDLLADQSEDLVERDVVIIVDTDPDAMSDLRTKLRPRGFMMVLVGKDGSVKLRKPFPWDVRELSRSIDKMPMRQSEISERRATTSGQ